MSPEKLEGEMYLANGDTSRRGTINLCQKHRSGQCGGATTRAVPRFVAGNCLSARETSRWNFPPPSFPSVFFDTLVILLSFQKEFFSNRESIRKKSWQFFEENFENGKISRIEIFKESKIFFFLRIENLSRENYFSIAEGKTCGGRINKRIWISARNCDYSKIFMVNDFRNARGIITSWKWNFGFNQNEIVNVGLEYYKRRTYYA